MCVFCLLPAEGFDGVEVCGLDGGDHAKDDADGNGEYLKEDGVTYEKLAGDTKVSMNVWGLTPEMIEYMKAGFVQFLTDMDKTNLKAEYYLPFAVDSAVQEGKGQVTVLESTDKWYGVTYAEDKQSVMDALKKMFEEGKYPELR
mgnify:CR=1 FL=1